MLPAKLFHFSASKPLFVLFIALYMNFLLNLWLALTLLGKKYRCLIYIGKHTQFPWSFIYAYHTCIFCFLDTCRNAQSARCLVILITAGIKVERFFSIVHRRILHFVVFFYIFSKRAGLIEPENGILSRFWIRVSIFRLPLALII